MNIRNLLIPILIIVLSSCLYIIYRQHQDKIKLNSTIEFLTNANSSYINEITSMKELKVQNEELYNLVNHFKATTATEVITKYIYNTDTVYVDAGIKNPYTNDSTYCFQEPNYELTINANRLNYYQLNINNQDTIRIFNDKTVITLNSEIVNSIRFKQRKKRYNKFHVGVQAGVGYGVISRKPDVFIGLGLGYSFN